VDIYGHQVEELGGGDGGQGLLVVRGDGLAVVPHVVGVLDDQAGIASDLNNMVARFFLGQHTKKGEIYQIPIKYTKGQ
jgi:hypothetical protein